MKIISKEMKKDGSQSIIYLVDDYGNALKADIVENQEEKNLTINTYLSEFFSDEDWVNDKEVLRNKVEEITYEEYINQ